MTKKAISTDKAPAAIGPYSQAIEIGNLIFTSGVIPVVPATGEIPSGVEAQAEQAFANLTELLKAAGTSTKKTVKTTVFIKNMDDFGKINEIYARYFQGVFPARSCVEVAMIAQRCAHRNQSHCGKIEKKPQKPRFFGAFLLFFTNFKKNIKNRLIFNSSML